MVKHKKLSMAVAGACALFGSSAANAIDIAAGDWTLSFGGEVNAFYTYTHCDNNPISIAGGLACGTTNQKSSSGVRSGLLPSALVFSAKTTQEGFDIGVTFGMYPGINSATTGGGLGGALGPGNGGGSPVGLGTSGIDFRQNFLTFGDKEIGTLKMGRDLGLFGSDAILNDLTLLGVGTVNGASAPGNTALGRIGVGYIYADWAPQITYISPSVSGFQGSIGIFQPYNTLDFAGIGDPALTAHQVPGVQGKLTYDYDLGGVTGRAWAGFFYQRFDSFTVGVSGAATYAGDLGVKAAYSGLEGMIYGYQGRGVGTTAFGFNGINLLGNKRNSNGGIAQLQYRIPGTKWKPGISYGVSRLAMASDECVAGCAAAVPTLVNRNRSGVAQLQYSLTKALTLVGEYTYTRANNQAGLARTNGSIAVGGILFF